MYSLIWGLLLNLIPFCPRTFFFLTSAVRAVLQALL